MASWIMFLASALIITGALLITADSITGMNGVTSGGAVILIGPIPVILGSGAFSVELMTAAAVLTVVGLVFFLLIRRKSVG